METTGRIAVEVPESMAQELAAVTQDFLAELRWRLTAIRLWLARSARIAMPPARMATRLTTARQAYLKASNTESNSRS